MSTRKGHKSFANVIRRYLIHLISRWKIVPPPDTRFAYRVIIPYPRVCPLLGPSPRSHRRGDLWRRFSFPFNLRFRIEFLYGEPYTIYSSLLHDICCSTFQYFKLFQIRITFLYMLIFAYKKYEVWYILLHLIHI